MNYKRFISYLYHYEMGEKVHNVGFARVELSNDLCRITASCTTRVISQKECHVYFIQSKKESVKGIDVLTVPVKDGEINLRVVMEDGKVPGSDVPFADITGVLFFFTRDNYIGTYWDNSTILYRDVKEMTEKKEEPVFPVKKEPSFVTVKPEEIEVVQPPVQNSEDVEELKQEKSETTEQEAMVEEIHCQPDIAAAGLSVENSYVDDETDIEMEMEMEQEEAEEDNTEAQEERIEEETVQAMGYQGINRNRFADHPGAREILNRFVRMYPFDDNEISECVRLGLRDIGLLPMNAWVLGNNSFLQHGYYTFRHILFGKKMTKDGWVYLLMVPGAMNPKEKELANQFGFRNFKASRRRCVRNGEFGYWYVPVDFNQ